jgi:hypothetical protein
MSINQQTFAGYLLAYIINRLQETGKCDPIFVEVLRLELTNLSGNPSWSDWSALTDFEKLYNFCVQQKIIVDYEVQLVPPESDGSYNVGKVLDGKFGSVLLEAQKWVPTIEELGNGVCSTKGCPRFQLSCVVLSNSLHFSTVILGNEIWLVDGKGKRTCAFTAESTTTMVSSEDFRAMCAKHGAFYFFEEVPLKCQKLYLSGITYLLPRIMISYGQLWWKLYDDGNMVCENTGEMIRIIKSFFASDKFGQHFHVFPPPTRPDCGVEVARFLPPPPPAPCAQSGWFLPPPPPAPCASGPLVPPPPPQAAGVQVSHRVLKVDTNTMDMIYVKSSWFLNNKGRDGKNLATGEIIRTGKTCQYKFGDSVFLSRDSLEIALQAKYGKVSRQCFD